MFVSRWPEHPWGWLECSLVRGAKVRGPHIPGRNIPRGCECRILHKKGTKTARLLKVLQVSLWIFRRHVSELTRHPSPSSRDVFVSLRTCTAKDLLREVLDFSVPHHSPDHRTFSEDCRTCSLIAARHSVGLSLALSRRVFVVSRRISSPGKNGHLFRLGVEPAVSEDLLVSYPLGL